MAALSLGSSILSQISLIETRVASLEKEPSICVTSPVCLRFEVEALRQRGIRVAGLSNDVFFSLRERLDQLCRMDAQGAKTERDRFLLNTQNLVLEIISATDLFVPGVPFKSDICKKHRAFLQNESYLSGLRDRVDKDLGIVSRPKDTLCRLLASQAIEFALLLELTHLKCFETRLEHLKNKPLPNDLSATEKRLAKIDVLGRRVIAFCRRDISREHKQSALFVVREVLDLKKQVLEDAFLQNEGSSERTLKGEAVDSSVLLCDELGHAGNCL